MIAAALFAVQVAGGVIWLIGVILCVTALDWRRMPLRRRPIALIASLFWPVIWWLMAWRSIADEAGAE